MPGIPTTPDGLWTITDTDSPDIPRDVNKLAETTQTALIARGKSAVPIFADAATANAWYTANGGAVAGNLRYLTNPGIYQTFDGAQWIFAYYIGVGFQANTALAPDVPFSPPWASWDPQPPNTTPIPFTTTQITIARNALYTIDFTAAVSLNTNGNCTLQTFVNGNSVANTSQYMAAGFNYTPGKGVAVSMNAGTTVTGKITANGVSGTCGIAVLRVAQISVL